MGRDAVAAISGSVSPVYHALVKTVTRRAAVMLILLALFLSSCSPLPTGSGPDPGGREPSQPTDPSIEHHRRTTVPIPGRPGRDPVGTGTYETYLGEYRVPGLPAVRYALGVQSAKEIDRLLVVINGGTGTPIEYTVESEFPTGVHRAVLVIGHRGMSSSDLERGCALGRGLIECLKQHRAFPTFNPLQSGEDVNRLIPLIRNSAEVRAVLTDPGGAVDLYTESYGATILGYALSNAEFPHPALRNVVIDGPSEPNELVITSGIANAKRFFANLLEYRAAHDPAATPYTISDLAAELARNRDRHVGTLFDDLNDAWEASNPDAAVALMNQFIQTPEAYYEHGWDSNYKLSLLQEQPFSPIVMAAFTSRIGYICSSYVNRTNDPDTSNRFREALAESDGVFRYGFLIKYRDLLSICPQLGERLEPLTAPSGRNAVAANAVLAYGGAMDVKHAPEEVDAMLAYFSGAAAKHRIVERYNAQGGGVMPECRLTAVRSLFVGDGSVDRSDCSG